MKVFAPGKLILSGEHSVLYGKPALAMAVDRYVIATTKPQTGQLISFDLSDLNYERGLTVSSLERLKDRIKEKYHRFLQGDFKIRDVLQKPFELAQFAMSLCLEILNVKLTQGMQIHLQSTIPIGCGMGSSAATILSIIHAVTQHVDMNLSKEAIYQLGLEAENVQHGRSSGLDLQVSLYGGCRYLKEAHIYPRPLPTLPLFLVNTGTPQSSTGECVSQAATYFKTSSIAEDFAAITNAMDAAINQQTSILNLIRENHQLLIQIGVVPASVQRFIADVEQMGGAAKVCGAGSVSGEQAGVLLVMLEDEAALRKTCDNYHYSILPIQGEARGVHVVV